VGQFILKRDDIKLGLVLGFLAPVIGVFIYYYWKISPYTWSDFLHLLKTNKSLVSSLTMICLFVNVFIFTLYINTRRDKTAKGIFAVTVLLALISLWYKFSG